MRTLLRLLALVMFIVAAGSSACNSAPGPVVLFVDPSVVYNGVSTRVTIYASTLETPLPADAVSIALDSGGGATQLQYNAVQDHPNRLQAIVPSGTAAGQYDLTVKDHAGTTTLKNALTVTGTLSVTLKS
ncbi:MAG TPA: hypothetical protein VLM85_20135, partial [Polyangiaceae bacterium]|nr:hypothetical protein [Polyangiaceae bacterium]